MKPSQVSSGVSRYIESKYFYGNLVHSPTEIMIADMLLRIYFSIIGRLPLNEISALQSKTFTVRLVNQQYI